MDIAKLYENVRTWIPNQDFTITVEVEYKKATECRACEMKHEGRLASVLFLVKRWTGSTWETWKGQTPEAVLKMMDGTTMAAKVTDLKDLGEVPVAVTASAIEKEP